MKKNKKDLTKKNKSCKPVRRDGHKKYRIKCVRGKQKKYGASYFFGMLLRILYRTVLVIVTVALLAAFGVYYTLTTVAKGPSETVRNALVLSAMQASATKWAPGLFLDQETIDEIVRSSQEKVVEEVDVIIPDTGDVTGPVYIPDDPESGPVEAPDISDGIEFHTDAAGSFRAYIMIVHDPSKVFVGISSTDFPNATRGQRIYDAADKYGALAAINGGEFQDTGGVGRGERPIGLTYSQGKCVWNDGRKRTFIGIDKNNNLVVSESMTKEKADELGIRDGVSFQSGNVLIETKDGATLCYYAPENNGKAQRTAIGQRADGKFIFIVTDGRSASSLGADYDEIINMLLKYGAINAGMLDGGSSAMMYYRNYITKYNVDVNELDEYQRLGLVNKYKAFTRPRYLPTFFMVMP
ncbi:MAG: phosphodiester glycosidase family protein [Clostridia bacterium]|nr:phosphodiester glycosidase family protein [Clostridia bacterium]